jgi:hypothetical protein
VPTAHLQRCTIGVYPEDDVLITDAACDVGFGNSSNSPINDMFAQVVKHILDSFFDFQLESCQRVFHATERRLKLSDGGANEPENDGEAEPAVSSVLLNSIRCADRGEEMPAGVVCVVLKIGGV